MVKIKEDPGCRERLEKLVGTHYIFESAHTEQSWEIVRNSHHLTAAWQLLRTESSHPDPISSRQVSQPQKPPSQVSLFCVSSAERPLSYLLAIKKVTGFNFSNKNSSWLVLSMICCGLKIYGFFLALNLSSYTSSFDT